MSHLLFTRQSLTIAILFAWCSTGPPVDVAAQTQFQYTLDDPTPGSGAFGREVELSDNYLLVGNPWDNTNFTNAGQAHLFDATTGNLLQTFNDPTAGAYDYLGTSLGVSANYTVIGESIYVHVFDTATGNFVMTIDNPTGDFNSSFGGPIAVSGNYALIGAPSENVQVGQTTNFNIGAAYLYDLTDTNANTNLIQTFNDPLITDMDYFGGALAIDGNLAVIGSTGHDYSGSSTHGQAHVFDIMTGNLVSTLDHPDLVNGANNFGRSVDIDGNYVIVGADGSDQPIEEGQAFVFDAQTGNLLTTIDDPTTGFTQGDFFGGSVAISDGLLLVGSERDDFDNTFNGHTYLYDLDGNLLQTLTNPEPGNSSSFGGGLSFDSGLFAIGAWGNLGQTHVYAAVPEPGTAMVIGVLLAGLAARRRR